MLEAIIYTDGSAGPTLPGKMGSGYHGYYFDRTLEFKKTTDLPPDGFISIYGYIGPDNALDYAKEDKTKISVNPLAYIDGMYTNPDKLGFANEAEVEAICQALLHVDKYNPNNDGELAKIGQLTILSDSQVALLVFNNATKILDKYKIDIEEADFKADEAIEKAHPNATDNIKLYLRMAMEAIAVIKSNNPDIKIEYNKIKGHSGNIGNEKADRLAVTARKNSGVLGWFRDDCRITYAPTRYWKANLERHPFLRYKELFFLHNDISNAPYVTIMNYTSAIPTGQRSAEPIYGLVKLTDDPLIDLIKNINTSYEKMFKYRPILLYAMDLNEVFNPEHLIDINNFGKYAFVKNPNEQLLLLDKYLTMFPIRPSGLAKQVYDKTNNFSFILENCLKDTSENRLENTKYKLVYQNITDLIFKKEVVKKKEKMSCILPNGNKHIDIKTKLNGKEINFKLYHNVDILDRNHLKALEKYTDIEVWLVYEQKSDTVYNYYTVIYIPSTNTYGIWQNLFSSRLFLEKVK